MQNAIVLRIDPLGRITIPSPYRKALGMYPGESIKMEYKDDQLIMWKPTKTDLELYIDKILHVAKENIAITDVEYAELELITKKLAKEE